MHHVTVESGQLRLNGRRVPLLSGEVQFWRMAPETWEPALRAVCHAGIPIVATYLSWRRHAPVAGVLDLEGRSDPRLDVRRFVQLCADRGLLVHLKPGPWICAEEPGGGYPDWLLSMDALGSLNAGGQPVSGYNPPFKHPVPSYLDPRYLAFARGWLQAVDRRLADLFYPAGPIALIQLDNEPSWCFQDTMYGADYHPAAVRAFREWALGRYSSPAAVGQAWGMDLASGADIRPPRTPASAAPMLPGDGAWQWEHDWIAFKEQAIARYLGLLRSYHAEAGAGHLLYTANYNTHPVHTVPQHPRLIQAHAGTVGGEDLYYIPPLSEDDLVRLARAAAGARADREPLPWAPEIQAGIWRSPGQPDDFPAPTAAEQALYYIAALAFGLKGLNFYMLVDRENWDLAPLVADGSPGPTLAAVRQVAGLVRRLPDWGRLRPVTPVALLWHRPYARDAYAVADLPGAAAVRRAPYDSWQAALAALVRAGHLPACWDSEEPDPPPGTGCVVVPGGPYLPAGLQERLVRLAVSGVQVLVLGQPPHLDERGRPCDRLSAALAAGGPGLAMVPAASELAGALAAAGAGPPVRCDTPGALALLHRSDTRSVLYLLHVGDQPVTAHLQFADIAAATWLPLLPAHPPVPVRQHGASLWLAPKSALVFALADTEPRGEAGAGEVLFPHGRGGSEC